MMTDYEINDSMATTENPPFLYEIQVKGRLSAEQWTSWFDDLTVTAARGESTLRGEVPDHAALYGLLARLRDLAIPLVAVRVLDAEAQRKLARTSRRYDLVITALMVMLYLLLLGGLTTLTVFVAQAVNVALVLTLLFALLGALAHGFWLWTGQRWWRWITYVMWPAAAITFLVFIPVSGILPPALGIGIMLLLLAGGLVYVISYLTRRAAEISAGLPQGNGILEARRGAGSPEAAAVEVAPETSEAGVGPDD
jgi:hypothetical protein